MQRYSGDADVTERLLAIVRDGLALRPEFGGPVA
jgi:hypothetical protein